MRTFEYEVQWFSLRGTGLLKGTWGTLGFPPNLISSSLSRFTRSSSLSLMIFLPFLSNVRQKEILPIISTLVYRKENHPNALRSGGLRCATLLLPFLLRKQPPEKDSDENDGDQLDVIHEQQEHVVLGNAQRVVRNPDKPVRTKYENNRNSGDHPQTKLDGKLFH